MTSKCKCGNPCGNVGRCKSCANKERKGTYHFSEKAKINISNSRKKFPTILPMIYTKYLNPMQDKHHSIKTKNKISDANSSNIVLQKEMNEKKSYMFGVICGDGHVAPKGFRIILCATDKEFVNYFGMCLYETYGIFVRYRKIRRPNPKNKLLYLGEICSKRAFEDILKYDLNNSLFRSRKWNIPDEILNSKNKKIISSFLKGFFDSEGYVCKGIVSASSVNPDGLKQVSYLLNKLEIENNFVKQSNCFMIRIQKAKQRKRFLEYIGFTIERKNKRLIEDIKKFDYKSMIYSKSMELHSRGLGNRKIFRILSDMNTPVPRRTITEWITNKHKPREL